MTAVKDLVDALIEVADHHDQDCPHQQVRVSLADHVGGDNTEPAPEVTR